MSQTVGRAVEVLELLASAPRTPTDLAAHLGVHRTTALRLLRPLVDGGLVRRAPDGRYAVGYRLAGLAAAALDQFDLREVARPHLAALAEACGCTVHLAAPRAGTVVYVDKIEPPGAVPLYSRVGRPVPLPTSAVGKAVLAHLPEPQAARLLAEDAGPAARTAAATAPDDTLRAELRAVRARGWAADDGEFEDFVACLAVPVRGHDETVAAAVSLTALKARTPLPVLSRSLPDLRTAAARISHELGSRAEPTTPNDPPPEAR